MVFTRRKILGLILAVIGFLGAIIICALPIWKVKYPRLTDCAPLIDYVIWEGLWINCMFLSRGYRQCKVYDSLSTLPQDLQAARVMIIITIIVGVFGVLLSIVSGKLTNSVSERQVCKVAIAAGIAFIIAGVMTLIPVSWTTIAVIQDNNFNIFFLNQTDLGASVYIGWGSAGLLILGGGLLCSSCPPNDDIIVKYSVYIGLVSSLLLLLGGVLLCFIRWKKARLSPSDYSHLTYTDSSTGRSTTMSDIIRSNSSATDPNQSTTSANVYHVYSLESLYSQVQEGYARPYAVPYSWAHVHI